MIILQRVRHAFDYARRLCRFVKQWQWIRVLAIAVLMQSFVISRYGHIHLSVCYRFRNSLSILHVSKGAHKRVCYVCDESSVNPLCIYWTCVRCTELDTNKSTAENDQIYRPPMLRVWLSIFNIKHANRWIFIIRSISVTFSAGVIIALGPIKIVKCVVCKNTNTENSTSSPHSINSKDKHLTHNRFGEWQLYQYTHPRTNK